MFFYLVKYKTLHFLVTTMTNMMTKDFCLVFTMISFSRSALICPQHRWAEYKTAVEGPWSFVMEIYGSDGPVVSSTIRRVTDYRCSNDNDVEFRTNRLRLILGPSWVHDRNTFRQLFSEICEEECDCQNVTVQVNYYNYDYKKWYQLGDFTYVYKNCDKLYWTNWIETTNCSLSRKRYYVRICADCDSDSVDNKYCDGDPTMQADCQPTWGAYIEEGLCVVTGCDPNAGEQTKRRECIYDDGSEATNPTLCSNQSTRVAEQCTNNTLPIECTARTSSATEFDNTSLYIGIGITLALIVILCIVLAVVLYRRRKHRTNSTPIQINPSTLDLPISRSLATGSTVFGHEQSVIPNHYNSEQMSSSHEYEQEHPIGRPIHQNFQTGFSTANELEQLPASHAYELEQSVVPNAYEFEQCEDSNDYECASNMPSGANPPIMSQPTYSTVQKHQKFTEENNEYSSLTTMNPVTESEYARLSTR